MLSVPNMVMIGGNSRNCGKTTMACEIISKLSVKQEVIGLKFTSVRLGETELHGNHTEDETTGYSIFEELNPDSQKDTSRMLKAGATRVFYIRNSETFIESSILHFMSKYINKRVIVCESRSLRNMIKPGFFLMMMRLPETGKAKEDIESFMSLADKVFCFDKDMHQMKQFADNLRFDTEVLSLFKDELN
jgi:hypothetical protein